MDTSVKLLNYELMQASFIGCRRHIVVIDGTHSSPLFDGDSWGNDIEGACGEMAFAKFANVYYDGSVNTFKKGGDVGKVQVRTRRQQNYQLLVRDIDRDSDAFVLVRGIAPRFTVVGWMYGHEAKKPEWLHAYGNGRPAYFAPDNMLRPPDTIMPLLVKG